MLRADADEQEEIRRGTPDKRHCRWLKKCPAACRAFPETIVTKGKTTVMAGDPCPNNPLEQTRVKEMVAALDDRAGLITEADRMADLVELGILPGLFELTPEEFEAARIAHAHRRAQQRLSGASFGAPTTED